jgi:hypothetical protein
MNRHNFARFSGVIIEVCTPHGLWFDRDQLSAALRFVMAGGLELAKHREIQELDQEIERKRSDAALAAMPGAVHTDGAFQGLDYTAFGNALLGALSHLFR